MKQQKNINVIFNGKQYFGIKEFDIRHIVLFIEPTLQGTFSTNIPISSANYRTTNPTKAKVYILKNSHWTTFEIYNDFGDLSTMKIRNKLLNEIEFAKQKAIEYKLL